LYNAEHPERLSATWSSLLPRGERVCYHRAALTCLPRLGPVVFARGRNRTPWKERAKTQQIFKENGGCNANSSSCGEQSRMNLQYSAASLNTATEYLSVSAGVGERCHLRRWRLQEQGHKAQRDGSRLAECQSPAPGLTQPGSLLPRRAGRAGICAVPFVAEVTFSFLCPKTP